MEYFKYCPFCILRRIDWTGEDGDWFPSSGICRDEGVLSEYNSLIWLVSWISPDSRGFVNWTRDWMIGEDCVVFNWNVNGILNRSCLINSAKLDLRLVELWERFVCSMTGEVRFNWVRSFFTAWSTWGLWSEIAWYEQSIRSEYKEEGKEGNE